MTAKWGETVDEGFALRYEHADGTKVRHVFRPHDGDDGTHEHVEWVNDGGRGWRPENTEVVTLIAMEGGELDPESESESGSESGVDR